MKEIFFAGIGILLSIFSSIAFANIKNVGPVVVIPGQSDNQTFFLWKRDLLFTSFDQDVFVYVKQCCTKQTQFYITLPEGSNGSFYLDYTDDQFSFDTKDQHLCKFDVSSDTVGNVFINTSAVADSSVSCSLTGTAQTKDLVIHLALNPIYLKKHGTR